MTRWRLCCRVSRPGERTWQTVWLILLLLADYILVVVPFFFAGLTLGGAFSAMARRISTLYFADLIGGGMGCLLIIAVLWVLPGQGVVLFAAGLAALAALFFSLQRCGDPAGPDVMEGSPVQTGGIAPSRILRWPVWSSCSPYRPSPIVCCRSDIPPSKPLYQA